MREESRSAEKEGSKVREEELEARRVERREEEEGVLDVLVRIRKNEETIRFE